MIKQQMNHEINLLSLHLQITLVKYSKLEALQIQSEKVPKHEKKYLALSYQVNETETTVIVKSPILNQIVVLFKDTHIRIMTDVNKYIEVSFRNEEYAKESLETTIDWWIEEIKTSFLIIRSEPDYVGQQGNMPA